MFCLECEGDPIVAQIGLIGVRIRDFVVAPIVADFGVEETLPLRSGTLSLRSIELSTMNIVRSIAFLPFLNTLT